MHIRSDMMLYVMERGEERRAEDIHIPRNKKKGRERERE
jgi:hypothetical protein